MSDSQSVQMSYSAIEQEAIILGAVMGMVDDMVNHSIFLLPGDKRENTNLLPQTSETLRQFSILLRDFLSPVMNKNKGAMPFDLPSTQGTKSTDRTTLFYLSLVCASPQIGSRVEYLSELVARFIDWLETEAVVPDVWLSSINVKVDLKIKRIDFIQMGGDIGKHNFLRLGGQAARLRKILANNGVTIDEGHSYAALPDCWDWFHVHLFAYHASTIAEFLNNIRYAIRLYVAPVAEEGYRITKVVDDHFVIHTYNRPADIVNEFAWNQYFGLLNSTRTKPNFPPFSVTASLKAEF
jgi:hypothetical protein